jgi:IS5 family transposase
LSQQRHDKNKLYSIHAPEVACISKGKSNKRYEFGCKVGVVTTMRRPFAVGIQAFEGNSFNCHTLSSSIEQAERIGSFKAGDIYVDRVYRGHDYSGNAIVHIVKLGWRKLPRNLRRWLNRHSVVEAVIGHSRNECRLVRNYLWGSEGDKINAILCGCGYNIRRPLREFIFWFYEIVFCGWSHYPVLLVLNNLNPFRLTFSEPTTYHPFTCFAAVISYRRTTMVRPVEPLFYLKRTKELL